MSKIDKAFKEKYDFYFAGCGANSVEKTIRENDCCRLLSWVNERKTIENRCKNGYGTFVDSGAFSAYTRNLEIDVDEYIEWLNEWHPNLERYCCWDTIPAGDITPEESAPKTWENYVYMRDRLVDPHKLVYCFHYGEDVSYLIQALESGIDFVALGGVARRGRKQRYEFFESLIPIFEEYPHVHVHAFGMTAIDLLNDFPYINSSDSSSWLYPPKFLRIDTDSFGTVFFGADKTKEINAKESVDNLNPLERALLEQELNSRGFTIDDMCHTGKGHTGNKERSDWCILYWKDKMNNGVQRNRQDE